MNNETIISTTYLNSNYNIGKSDWFINSKKSTTLLGRYYVMILSHNLKWKVCTHMQKGSLRIQQFKSFQIFKKTSFM